MAIDVSVLVVGAGPTGLLLAAELHRRGVACRLIDAHREPMHWDRATVVHPRSLEIFESLGIVAPFLAGGAKQKIARLHAAGEVLGEIDLAECGSRYGFNIGISEEVTESILTDYLHRQGGEVLARRAWSDCRNGGTASSRDRHGDASAEEVAVQWVVGCDGYTARRASSAASSWRATTFPIRGRCSTSRWRAGRTPTRGTLRTSTISR